MTVAKIIPFRAPDDIRQRILHALSTLVARMGPSNLSLASIAAEAGLDEALVKRTFGGFGQLLDAFAQSDAFWPPLGELAGGDIEALRGRPVGEVLTLFFRNYLRGVMDRPWTLAVMEAESRSEKNLLTLALLYIRERRALEFFEATLDGELPDGLDLSAVVLLMAMAVSFLGIRSRSDRTLGGIDVHSSVGMQRIESTIEYLLQRSIDQGSA